MFMVRRLRDGWFRTRQAGWSPIVDRAGVFSSRQMRWTYDYPGSGYQVLPIRIEVPPCPPDPTLAQAQAQIQPPAAAPLR